jgi:predicted ester cyclase
VAKAGTSGETNKAVVLRYVEEVWNDHDLGAIDALVWPDYLNHAARTAEYERGGARRAVEWLLSVFPDHRFEVEDAAADGETVALRGTMTATHEGDLMGIAPTGKRVAASQSHWFRVVDGKISEHWAVRDDLSMLLQLGVIPEHGQPGEAGSTRWMAFYSPNLVEGVFAEVRL